MYRFILTTIHPTNLSNTADQSILDAVSANVRPRADVEEHARQLASFVFSHLELASVSLVDIFSANLWDTVVDPEWAAELMTLTDEEVALLSAGLLQRSWQSQSLACFVSTAQKLDLPRECAVPQADTERRFPLVAMSEKKAHEVRVLAHVAAHLAYQHSLQVFARARNNRSCIYHSYVCVCVCVCACVCVCTLLRIFFTQFVLLSELILSTEPKHVKALTKLSRW
jgi:hypothetical protein